MADQGGPPSRPRPAPLDLGRYLGRERERDLETERGPDTRRVIAPATSLTAPTPSVRVVTGPMFVDTASGTFRKAGPKPPEAMSRLEFEAELQRLVDAYAEDEGNPGSLKCKGCRRCVSCTFCTDCEECYHCTHSKGCRQSSQLTQCRECVGCHDCAYCVRSESCARSNYLVLCRSCSECSYCFGCIGLGKADFHILNVKYTKSEYFRIVKSLGAAVGVGG